MFRYTSKCKSGLELLSLCFSSCVSPLRFCQYFPAVQFSDGNLKSLQMKLCQITWGCFQRLGGLLQGPFLSHVSLTPPSVWHGTKLCCFSLTCAVPVQFIIQGKAFVHRGGTLVDLRGSSKLINFPGVYFLNGRIPCSCLKGKDVTAWFQFGSTSPYFSFVLENSLDFCICLGIF